MKHKCSIIKRGRDYTDLMGLAHFVPNRNRPNGRARLPNVRNGQVVGFRSPSVGDPEKRCNNMPLTNSEVIRESKQLGTFVDHPSRVKK